MESKLVLLNTPQLCGFCGHKITKGMDAVVAPEENLFFCNSDCLIRDLQEFDDDEYD